MEDKRVIATDLLISGWVDYVRSQVDEIEASFADSKTGKVAAGRYCGAAESIRQVIICCTRLRKKVRKRRKES